MKKLLISLAAVSSWGAFVVLLITMLSGIRKTLLASVELTDSEKQLIEKLGNTTWTDYFFTILTLVMLLMTAVFLTVVIFKDRSCFASASHITSLVSLLMTVICMDSAFNGKAALLYNNVLVIASLILAVLAFAFLLFYSAMAITADEFKRYL